MQADRAADADREPDELLRRDRAGRLPRRQPGAGHRRHQRPAAAGAAVLLPRHPAHPAGRTELPPDPDQPAARAGQRHAPRRLPPGRRARRRGAVPAELAGRRLPVPRGRGRRRLRRRAGPRSPRRVKIRAKPGVVRRPLQPGAAVLAEHDAAVEQEHIVLAYTFELAKCYEQAVKERQLLALANIDPDLCAPGGGRPRPARRPSRPSPLVDLDPSPALSQVGGRPGRPTGGWSASSSTPTATWTASTRSRRRSRPPAWCRSWSRRTAASCRTAWPSSARFGATRSVEFDAVLVAGLPGARRRRARRARQQGRGGRRAGARPAGRRCCSRSVPAREGDRRLGRRRATRCDLAGLSADDAGSSRAGRAHRGLRRGPRPARGAPRVGAVRPGARLVRPGRAGGACTVLPSSSA